MKKSIKKTFALLLALMMLVTVLAACKKEADPTVADPTPAAPGEPGDPGDGPAAPSDPKTLVVGYSEFSQKFSPFFASSAYDNDAVTLTQIAVFGNDRAGQLVLNGIEGETLPYNGVDYTYYGPANVSIMQNPNGTVDYTIVLREDIVFSDGVPLTIDDAIFSMYVLSDPDYDGSSTFYSLPITGMNNYRTGVSNEIYEKYEALGYAIYEAGIDNDDFTDWTEAQQEGFWECFNVAGIDFAQEIIEYCLPYGADYFEAVYDSEGALGMFLWGFADFNDEDMFEALSGEVFDLANGVEPTAVDFWNEIVTEYGYDFDGINYESAGSDIESTVINAFISVEGPNDPTAGGAINNIAGIKKNNDYSVTVTTDYFEASSIYQLGFQIAPLHYYGDASMYDYDNDMFGFTKGDLSVIRTKTTQPLGAGPYKFLSYEAGVVSYEANENYFEGEPKIKFLRLQEVGEADKLSGIVSGSIDLSEPSFSQTNIESIKGHNSNGELTGDIITSLPFDFLGYGFIGINAETVNVGGEPASEASKNLRRAIATLLAVNRDTVTNSYYGDIASTIQYPISNTSWAAPRPNDEGYRVAFSVDVDGNDIYNDSMTEQEKQEAALEAAIGFFKAAGYTWDDASGTFTAAPAGASLIYEVITAGQGVGDHPAYGNLIMVKEALAPIGITLDVTDPSDANVLWDALDAGAQNLWTMSWGATIDPDMYQVYHSSNVPGEGGTGSNYYHIRDSLLDELIIEARQSDNQTFRKATYKQALDILMDWAVEVPNFQRKNTYTLSTERVNIDTMTSDITPFWNWYAEIHLLEMN